MRSIIPFHFMVRIDNFLRPLISSQRRHHLGHFDYRTDIRPFEQPLDHPRIHCRLWRLIGPVEPIAGLLQVLRIVKGDEIEPADNGVRR